MDSQLDFQKKKREFLVETICTNSHLDCNGDFDSDIEKKITTVDIRIEINRF